MAKVFASHTNAEGQITYMAVEVQSEDITAALVAAGIVPQGMRLLLCHGNSDPLTLEFERSSETVTE
jgi:hypothetical protein